NASELSEIFKALANGQITSKDIPAYRFQSPLDKLLNNFLPMMDHWQWRDPHQAVKRINKRVFEPIRKQASVNW
ncbi:MAG TPA: hypothetical protein VK308_01685, partial [Pyrinomonadaceae bacterium]|nr:hypothetical protein [Pyrinomonadaceae bacterium]